MGTHNECTEGRSEDALFVSEMTVVDAVAASP